MKIKAVIPCDGGLNKYYPSSLIDNSSYTDLSNMRFGVGFIEKVDGWIKFSATSLGSEIRAIDKYSKYNGDAYLVFQTNSKIYTYLDATAEFKDMSIPPVWESTTTYNSDSSSLASFCIPTVADGKYYQCTTSGVSGASEPTWDTVTGNTTSDGSAVWTCMGNYLTLSGSGDSPVFAENAEDKIVFTNGIDSLKYWNGSNDVIRDLPGTNELEGYAGSSNTLKAKCMSYFNNFLVLGNTEENGDAFPQRIRWSKFGDIESWKNDANGSGQAGYADLTEGVDWVQRIMPLSNYLVIYKEKSIQILSYVGGSTIWDKRPVIIGTGLIAPKAIVDTGDRHIFIGANNIYSFDLVEPKEIGNEIATYFFSSLLHPTYSYNITSFYIEEISEAWFTFASINSTDGTQDMAIVYNVDTQKWSIRDMPMTAFGKYTLQDYTTYDTETLTYDELNVSYDSTSKLAGSPTNLCGDVNGYIYKLEGTSKDDLDLPCYAITKLFDLDNPAGIKRLKRIQLMTSKEEGYDLNVYVGCSEYMEEPPTWYGPYTMSLSDSIPPWIDVDLSSRYFCLKFETLLKSQPFKLVGYSMWYEDRSNQ